MQLAARGDRPFFGDSVRILAGAMRAGDLATVIHDDVRWRAVLLTTARFGDLLASDGGDY